MIKTIINPKQIENAVVKIECDKEEGSGFFIAPNIIMTAQHVVD